MDPWFLDTNLRADLTAFADHREEPAFTRRDYGASFFLTKELNPAINLTAGYTLRNTSLSDLGTTVQEEEFQQNYDLSSIKLQVTYDTRNDLFFPTSGQKAFTAVEQRRVWMSGSIRTVRRVKTKTGTWCISALAWLFSTGGANRASGHRRLRLHLHRCTFCQPFSII